MEDHTAQQGCCPPVDRRGTSRTILLLLALLLFSNAPQAQTDLDSLKAIWRNEAMPDSVRLRALGRFAWEGYLFSQPDSAIHYARLMYTMAERAGSKVQMAWALRGEGVAHKVSGDNMDALDRWTRSEVMSREAGDLVGEAGSLNNIGMLYTELGELPRALEYHLRSLELRKRAGDVKGLSGSYRNIGKVYESMGRYDDALEQFRLSLHLLDSIGSAHGMASSFADMAEISLARAQPDTAIALYRRSLALAAQTADRMLEARAWNGLAKVHISSGHGREAVEAALLALKLATGLGELKEQKAACELLHAGYKLLGQRDEALRYLERSAALNDSMDEARLVAGLERMEFDKERERNEVERRRQERNTRELFEARMQAEERTRNLVLLAGLFVAAMSIGLLSRLRYIRRSNATLEREKARSDKLLLNILPEDIAKELKDTGEAQARSFDRITILFTDLKDFTRISAQMHPHELVSELNIFFARFDRICDMYGIEKIKTIGDAYMAAGGLRDPAPMSARNVVLAALEMQDFMREHALKRKAAGLPALAMRAGVHTGPVVAGIVGSNKFQYDIWGDAVNIASRMENCGLEGEVNVSAATYDLIKDNDQLSFTARGRVEVKGMGGMEMFFVHRRPS
ncbi:MAG: tetratricopeptide repeat protein [Flavobacteriales bacterium]|nr:tetratricopeptide repeat protein [Flavobacteriales bacterium]